MTRDRAILDAQPRAVLTLERILDEGRAHALLLSGAVGAGTITAAERIAQRVLCPGTGDDGCSVCLRVAKRVHPDLHWIAPEGGALAIDQIRDVVDVVSRMPFEATAQVVVIEAAETLSSDNAEAGNSLLKALEEPLGQVVFVLVATRAAKVLPTIRSRAIEIAFPPIADDRLIEALRAEGADEARVAAATGLDLLGVARASRGDLHRARAILAGDTDAQRRGDVHAAMQAVVSGTAAPSTLANRILDRAGAAGDAAAAAATAQFEAMLEQMSAAEQRSFTAKSNDQGMEKRTARRARRARVGELRACLDELASWWRDVLAQSVGAVEAVTNLDRVEHTAAAGAGAAGPRAVAALDAIDDAAARLLLNNADEPVTIGALAAELAALADGRIRARRALDSGARTPAGYDLALG